MKILASVWQTSVAIIAVSVLVACANDPVKAPQAGAKPIHYGCSGASMVDCMTFSPPAKPATQR